MNNDPEGAGAEPLRGQDAPLVRALGLQVPDGREEGSRGRDHHPHDAVGRLRLAGRPDSWAGEHFELPDDGSPRVADRRCGRPRSLRGRSRARRQGPRRAARLGRVALLPAGAARRHGSPSRCHERDRPEGIRQRHRRCSRGRIRSAPARPSIYTAHHDHLGIKAGAGAGRRCDLQRRARQRLRRGGDPLRREGVRGPRHAAPRAASTSRSWPRRSRASSGSEYLATHPPVPVGTDRRQHQHRFGQLVRARRATSSLIGLGKSSLDARRDRRRENAGSRGEAGPVSGAAARSTAPTSSTSRRPACPRRTSKFGTDVIGKPPGWGKEQVEAYEKNTYHQPSDEYRDSLDFAGAVEDARLAFLLGCRVADADADAALDTGRRIRGRAEEGAGRDQVGLRSKSKV